jgi:L-galactonate dehydratase
MPLHSSPTPILSFIATSPYRPSSQSYFPDIVFPCRPLNNLTTPQTFTIGRGNEIVCTAITHLADRIKGRTLESLVSNWGQTWRHLVNDSQLRWIGPEKGVIHLALGAVVNAIWDLWAKTLGKPVWRIVADMTPQQIVDLIDFRYITDAITPEEALEILTKSEQGKKERLQEAIESKAVPAYTTSAGWLGYGEDKMRGLLKETLSKGYKHFKLKVGSDVAQDKQRLSIAREIIGFDKGNVLMVDANQVWSVPEAIEYMKQLKEFKPWFIEEPTSPDDGKVLLLLIPFLRRVWDERANANYSSWTQGD